MAQHPLKSWLSALVEPPEEPRTYESLAARLRGLQPTAESIRQVANGYRLPSWDLAFEIESVTGISAHELRDRALYPVKGAA